MFDVLGTADSGVVGQGTRVSPILRHCLCIDWLLRVIAMLDSSSETKPTFDCGMRIFHGFTIELVD
ncbi:hypothetical protein ACLOJK_040463 [Asimina triloba]